VRSSFRVFGIQAETHTPLWGLAIQPTRSRV
jgi:hypothetical protein